MPRCDGHVLQPVCFKFFNAHLLIEEERETIVGQVYTAMSAEAKEEEAKANKEADKPPCDTGNKHVETVSPLVHIVLVAVHLSC